MMIDVVPRKEKWDLLKKEIKVHRIKGQDDDDITHTEFILMGYFWPLHSTYLVGVPAIHIGLQWKGSASSEAENRCCYKWFLYVDVITVCGYTGTFSGED